MCPALWWIRGDWLAVAPTRSRHPSALGWRLRVELGYISVASVQSLGDEQHRSVLTVAATGGGRPSAVGFEVFAPFDKR